MSDDDLWRPTDPANGSGEDAEQPEPAEGPSPDVTDETQPITGAPSAPPPPSPSPSPPSTSYAPPSGPGAVPPPQNPYGQPYSQPYGQPQNQYGGQPYTPPPNPYPAPNEYGAPQNPYGVPYQPAYAGGMLPDHPSATTSMVLGIVGLVGVALCGGITLVLAPFAWVIGAKAVREIDSQPGRYGGRDRAQGGKIMGIIGTVLLILGVVAIISFVVLAIAVGSSSGTDPNPAYPSFQNG